VVSACLFLLPSSNLRSFVKAFARDYTLNTSLTHSKIIITFLFLMGLVFAQAPSSFENTEITSRVNSVLNVAATPFLATGNGSTSDNRAIQMAIDSASISGGSVLIPAGTYIVDSTIRVHSNTQLEGTGFGSTIKARSELPHFYMSGVIRVDSNAANVIIENLHVEGPWTYGQASGAIHGIMLDRNVKNCKILNNYVNGASWSGIFTRDSSCSGHIIEGNHSYNNSVDGIEISGSRTVVANNYVSANGWGPAGGSGIEVVSEPNYPIDHIVVIGNVLKDNSHGIFSYSGDVSQLTISDNSICGGLRGVEIQASPKTSGDIIISGNVVSKTTDFGIGIGSGICGFSITGCAIDSAGNGVGIGIVIAGTASRGLISSCVISNCWQGIGVSYPASDNQVGDNVFVNDSTNVVNNAIRTRLPPKE
jgi:parallel beta-helix repeat protein